MCFCRRFHIGTASYYDCGRVLLFVSVIMPLLARIDFDVHYVQLLWLFLVLVVCFFLLLLPSCLYFRPFARLLK